MTLILYEDPFVSKACRKSLALYKIPVEAVGEAIKPPDAITQYRFGRYCLTFRDFAAKWCQKVPGLRFVIINKNNKKYMLFFCTFLHCGRAGYQPKQYQLCLPTFIDIIPASTYKAQTAETLADMQKAIKELCQNVSAEMGYELSLHVNPALATGVCSDLVAVA